MPPAACAGPLALERACSAARVIRTVALERTWSRGTATTFECRGTLIVETRVQSLQVIEPLDEFGDGAGGRPTRRPIAVITDFDFQRPEKALGRRIVEA